MKNSKKREEILNLFRSGGLFTANEISEKLTDIDRATIYRNIHLFIDQGVIREVNVKKGIASYELNVKGDHHQHFICLECEKIIPIQVDESFMRKIMPKGVLVNDYEINIKGKCNHCK